MTNRRNFLKTSALGTIAVTMGGLGFSAKSYRQISRSNDRVNLAVIGIRGQGGGHIRTWCQLKDSSNVRLKTICDVDEQFFAPKSKEILDSTGEAPVTEWDMRKVFDDKEIDAVSFGTPNHWHALGTIWACQAGKHVYVEKPASYGVWEGRKMVEAARKYNVRVQTGLQNRSIPQVMNAIKFLHDGGIGKVYLARGLCYKPRDSFGIAPDGTPPASLHYDMWLGPAPMRPYNEKRVHYNWHWFWATGGGDTANQGPHQFDVARWGLNKNEHPLTIYSMGGIYGIDPAECEQETPNTQTSVFQYSDGTILEFETRGRYTNAESSQSVKIGNMFLGTDGYVEINGSQWKAFRKDESEPFAGEYSEGTAGGRRQAPAPGEKSDFTPPPGRGGHYINFIDAIRAGNNEALNCDINEGYMSAALPALANISYRLNKKLTFYGAKEKFVNDKEADKMLTREYRKPYVVPQNV